MDSSPDPQTHSTAADTVRAAYGIRSEREQVLEAMLRVAAAKGYERTTIADVVEAAGVSRETFDVLFEDKHACFLAAYDAATDVGVACMSNGFESAAGQPWPDRVATALRALVELFAAEADIIHMAMVEVTAMGEDPRVRYRDALIRFEQFFEEGHEYSPEGAKLPEDTASFAVAAATSMIFDEVRAGRGRDLPRILPDLLYAVLMPYLGPEAAEVEMKRVAAAG